MLKNVPLMFINKAKVSLRRSQKNLCQEMGLQVHSDLKAFKLSVAHLYLFPVQVFPCTSPDFHKAHFFTVTASWRSERTKDAL